MLKSTKYYQKAQKVPKIGGESTDGESTDLKKSVLSPSVLSHVFLNYFWIAKSFLRI